nr:hypothetical protein [Actinoplanes siamensis]
MDPWTAFAITEAEKPPGRIRRGLRAFGRRLVHEYSLAVYLSAIFAVGLTWPTLRYPLHTLPQDLADPSRQAWQVAWLGHVLRTNPVKLWQSNAYFPTTDSLAYGDSLLGYAPAGLFGTGPEAAVLRYNILFVLAHALLLFGAYALVRQLGARPTGAAVAAAAFAFAPWRLAQEGHLDIVSAGAIPLALALLARGHGWSIRYGFRPGHRNAWWAALGWLVAIWQISLGFSLGVPFAYVLGAIVLFLLVAVPIRRLLQWRREKRRKARPSKAEAAKTEPAKTEPAKTEPAKTEPAKTEPAKTEPDEAEPGRTEAAKAPAGKTEPAQSAPDKAQINNAEVIKPEPGKKEEPNKKEEPSKKEAAEKPADKKDAAETKDTAEKQDTAGEAAGKKSDKPEKAEKAKKPGKPRKPRRESRAVLGWPLLLADFLGVLFLAGVGAILAIPYLRVPDSPTRGTEIDFFSPPLQSLLIGPAESRIWGAAHATPRASLGWAAEMSLLPGFMLYALALAGLLFSIWRWRQRLFLILGLAVAVILTLGTTFFDGRWTYLPLFGHLPASFDQRVPGRLMLWTTLLLAILAAGAVDEFVRRAEQFAAQRTPPWPGPWLRLATLLPLLLVLLEGWNATAHPVTPIQPAALRTVGGPMLVLPTDPLSDQTVQLWTTSRYQQVTNGGGNVAVARQAEMRQKVTSFPDVTSIEYLRSLGVNTVLLIRSGVANTPWEQAGDMPVDTLGITREDLTDAVVFHLN